MCTVIITVPDGAEPDGASVRDPGSLTRDPVRLLAVRDEDPGRAWNRLGAWWPDAYPGVIGIRDVRAGGAWLAADPARRRLSVLLNRADLSDRPADEVRTRGTVALESVAGRSPVGDPPMRGFNLVEVTDRAARVVSWDGLALTTTDLPPGTHMIAHDDVDDADTARIAQWLPEFRGSAESQGAGVTGDDWWTPWLSIVERSAQLPGTADSAIIRRQSFEGVPSYSLLIAVASIGRDGLDVRDAPLAQPGHWSPVDLAPDHG